MKQILQDARSGRLELVDVPAPHPATGQVLVRTSFSVVSPGTDSLALAFARKSLLGKARSRPDLVRQVTRKLRQEGPLPTWRAVTNRLDAPQPLGYSSAGVVEAVGDGVAGFAPGDRVVCAGAGYANHAEFAVVPENLTALVPAEVALEKAAFATLGAIALQGVRVAAPTLGEIAAVVGLGLIGQLAVQLLCANGCRVLGIDLDPARAEQARLQGARWIARPEDDLDSWVAREASGYGADLVLVAASASSAAPLALAGELCRQKGRVSVVGAMPMEIDRRTFYEKELELRMSTSYGPGRYDRGYEESGLDYPLPWVRWTENRNLQAFLELVASGAVDPGKLEAETVPFSEATRVYDELGRGERRSLATVFRYDEEAVAERGLELEAEPTRGRARPADGQVGVAFLGAGAYARAVLLPALKRCRGVRRNALVTATGPSARRTAERFGFARCGTDPSEITADSEVDLVFVATRHDSHAELAASALRAGKAVWIEKPIGLEPEQVETVLAAARESGALLAVGYNRRFSPHAVAIRDVFSERRGPLSIHYSVSAGPPPRGSWITDPKVGGGRIVGEVCHFVDLCCFLIGSAPVRVFAHRPGRDPETDDSLIGLLAFDDGSSAVIEYLAHASPALPKERFEVSADAQTARCDNFRTTRLSGGAGRGGRTLVRTLNQDKGQAAAVARVVEAVRCGEPGPFTLDELAGVARATFALASGAGRVQLLEPWG